MDDSNSAGAARHSLLALAQHDYDIYVADDFAGGTFDPANLGSSVTWSQSGADWTAAPQEQTTSDFATLLTNRTNAGGYSGFVRVFIVPTTTSAGAKRGAFSREKFPK